MFWIAGVVICIGLVCTLGIAYAKQKGLIATSLVVIFIPLLTSIGVGLVSAPLALNVAQTGAVSGYHQFLNGTVVRVHKHTDQCTRDGSCAHKYPCDSYTVLVAKKYTVNGKTKTREVPETKYHHCPYVTAEYTYTITAVAYHTFTYTLVSHGFAAHPHEWRPSDNQGIPSGVPRGAPKQWLKANKDLAAGKSDPITAPDTYANYILPNESTILRAYSNDIGLLRKDRLLPGNPQVPIYSNYLAKKVSFIKLSPKKVMQAAWQSAVMHLNAALGTELEGDMHVVAVNTDALNSVVSPDDYANAIQADWLNDYGKDAIAKNAIILVVGVDPTTNTISWARATTGMPSGNETMLQELQTQLQDITFDPTTVFGNTTAQVTQKSGQYSVHYTIGSGLVSQIVMDKYPFERACMNCTSARDRKVDAGQQGYVYLKTELPLPTWGVILTIFIDLVILAIVCLIAYAINQYIRNPGSTSSYARY